MTSQQDNQNYKHSWKLQENNSTSNINITFQEALANLKLYLNGVSENVSNMSLNTENLNQTIGCENATAIITKEDNFIQEKLHADQIDWQAITETEYDNKENSNQEKLPLATTLKTGITN